VKEDVCTYKEQYPGASQQNIANLSPIYGVSPSISQHCVGDILREKRMDEQDMWKCELVEGCKT
jgi:hypothetical protein